ncbi:hypothetical protein ACHAWF_015607 [Thalassiosira exigua]
MRLDAMIAPTAVGLCGLCLLSAAPLQLGHVGVDGFPPPRPRGHGKVRCHSESDRRLCSSNRPCHPPPLSCSVAICKSGHRNDVFGLRLMGKSASDNDDYIDAVVEEKTAGLSLNNEEITPTKERKRDVFKQALRDIASLSLVDYKWRSALFKKNEADRMEEEWMARMMGEDPSYARPMDAGEETRGPLGNAERSAVKWLTSVIEEEGKRAQRIAESDGELIRPKDLSPGDEAGPLSELERRAIQFLNDITDSEVERVRSGTFRPKDMQTPGPLGEAEARAVLALGRIVESEKFRMDQSRQRGGEMVRPIDVPGPLGEFERYIGDIMRAELQRVKDREANEGKLVRPKDGSMKSGLSEVESKAVNDWEILKSEERERLFSLQRFLNERRPMEMDKDSPLGVTEAFTVGLLRGPKLLGRVVGRVRELMKSEELDGEDQQMMQKSLPASSGNSDTEDANSSSEKEKLSGPKDDDVKS